MSIVMSDAYKAILLDKERTFLNGLSYWLFSNNNTPTGASVTTDFAEITTSIDSGGGPKTPVFTAATVVANKGELDAPALVWTFAGNVSLPITVWGYIVTDPGNSNAFVFGEKRSASASITAAGDTYTVVPKKLMDTM